MAFCLSSLATPLQDLDSDQIGHIDSSETSDNTEALHGESLVDDISSVLGHDMLGAIMDNTITEDTTTICAPERPGRKRSLKKKLSATAPAKVDEEPEQPQQFGFENRAFEMDNRYYVTYCYALIALNGQVLTQG